MPSYVSTSIAGLNCLCYLTWYDRGTAESRAKAIKALSENGLAVGLESPTKAIVHGVAKDTSQGPKREIVMYQGRLIDGPEVNREVYFFPMQISEEPGDTVPPAPLDDASRKVYRKYRAAIATANARASGVDLSVRSVALGRERAEAIRSVAKENHLAIGELEEIVRIGEIDDGRAQRRAERAYQASLKARNEALLNYMGRQLDAQLASVLQRAEAQTSSRSYFPPSGPGRLNGGVVIYGRLGHPLDRMTFVDGPASVRPLK